MSSGGNRLTLWAWQPINPMGTRKNFDTNFRQKTNNLKNKIVHNSTLNLSARRHSYLHEIQLSTRLNNIYTLQVAPITTVNSYAESLWIRTREQCCRASESLTLSAEWLWQWRRSWWCWRWLPWNPASDSLSRPEKILKNDQVFQWTEQFQI